jgi:hypothetical protein
MPAASGCLWFGLRCRPLQRHPRYLGFGSLSLHSDLQPASGRGPSGLRIGVRDPAAGQR